MAWLTRLARSLRFRLTLSYVALFTVLLLLIGWVFREALQSQLENEVRAVLDAEWNTARGYLRVVNHRAVWTADTSDPEEAHIVDRLRYVHLVADEKGQVLTDSPTYEAIGVDTITEIRRVLALKEPEIRLRYSASGEPFLIKAGIMRDEHRAPYFFAIGHSLNDPRRTVAEFARTFFLYIPLLLALTGALGWLLAGRAIEPVNSVALVAQRVTGSNLSQQIPLRGAGDELDHLIDSFNRMTARLERSFEQTRQFSTDVSHELRTPLTAIRGQLEVALFTGQTKEQYQEAILVALEAVEQLSSLVRALLLLSQAESGQVVLQKSPIDLAAIVRDITEQFQIPAEEKEIAVLAVVDQPEMVTGDRTQLERLVSNLVSNALKYTHPEGKVTLRVGRESNGWVRLVVEDTGVGIPSENLPHIFDRFYRVRNPETNKIQGLGLGLSFVSWIVSAHGGKIDVSSKVGEGTCFTLLFPPKEASGQTAVEQAVTAESGRV